MRRRLYSSIACCCYSLPPQEHLTSDVRVLHACSIFASPGIQSTQSQHPLSMPLNNYVWHLFCSCCCCCRSKLRHLLAVEGSRWGRGGVGEVSGGGHALGLGAGVEVLGLALLRWHSILFFNSAAPNSNISK